MLIPTNRIKKLKSHRERGKEKRVNKEKLEPLNKRARPLSKKQEYPDAKEQD